MDCRAVVVITAFLVSCAQGLVAKLHGGLVRRAQAIVSMHNFDYDVAIVLCSTILESSHMNALRLGVASVDMEPRYTLDLCSAQ